MKQPKTPRARHDASSPRNLLVAALETLGGGAVVVLDEELRIVDATPRADALLGTLPRGVLAPKVLCGTTPHRPVAEALAAGCAVDASIPSPTGVGQIRVRASAITRDGKRIGSILLFDGAASAGDEPVRFGGMWSRDPAMKQVFHLIEKVAASEATVLVRGETGVGKELVARAIHDLSPRSRKPFLAINCAAVPASLLESELFGHVRGSFTGAVRDHPGHFRSATGGTLLLDEVAELPFDLQAKLLRVLETHSVLPVGGSDPVDVDVRVIAATHRSLRKEVAEDRFRADLMYRLRVIPVFLPPLRERRDDIVLLAEKLIEELAPKARRPIARIAPDARAALKRYDWPGNVRELRNAIEYAFVVGEGPVLLASDLPPEITSPTEPRDGATIVVAKPSTPAAPETARILQALERANGSKTRAAKALGMSRVTLWRRLRELGLES